MIPASHQGKWSGENRLWFEDPVVPERSPGAIDVRASALAYRWAYRDTAQEGAIELSGPAGALRADWKDSWHAAEGMVLHGRMDAGVVMLYGTYPAGDGPAWGWRIELDLRDPEYFGLRMFNLEPRGTITIAVDLRGARTPS